MKTNYKVLFYAQPGNVLVTEPHWEHHVKSKNAVDGLEFALLTAQLKPGDYVGEVSWEKSYIIKFNVTIPNRDED